MTAAVAGSVAPGFERVADTFGGLRLGEGGAGLCVYAHGDPVVDCWAGAAAPDRIWEHDTPAVLFSATKALTAATVMLVASRGMVDTDAPVVSYWPEFGACGKERTLVGHVLAHRAGVLSFAGHSELLDWDGNGWDEHREIARRIAAATPAWEPGTRHGYHALTYGWILDELVRRVDGRSVGRVLAEDIAGPLGAEVRIGTPPEVFGEVARVSPAPVPASGPAGDAWRAWQDPVTLGGQAFFAGPRGSLMSRAGDVAGSARFLAAEVPAGNATGTARGLAQVCAALADAASESSAAAIWAPDTVAGWRVERSCGPDAVMGVTTRWGLGFELPVDGAPPGAVTPLATSPHAFGHGGYGGQLALADPRHRIGIGFVRSHLEAGWPSAVGLVEALAACL